MGDENITSALLSRATISLERNRRRGSTIKTMAKDGALVGFMLSLRRVQLILVGVILVGIFLVPPVFAFTADVVHQPRVRGVFKKKKVRTVKSKSLEGSLTAYYWFFAVSAVLVMAWRRIPEYGDDETIFLEHDNKEDAGSAKTVLDDATAETMISQSDDPEVARASVVIPSKERYQVEGEIGRGGMGIVYRGVDSLLDRPVALKSLSMTRSGDTTARERFLREAKALAQLTHPSIVQVYDLTELDGELFMAMELVDGEDLSDHLDNIGSYSVKDALTLGVDMAEALAYAHGRGVVHRDFKPGNVLLTEDGNAKVMDFGLAKITAQPSMTLQGAVMGSPNYMSPEQASGSSTDERTDVYALGITLFEMIAGEPPFSGDPMQIMAQHIHKKHPDLREKSDEVPDALAHLLDGMLAKKTEDRLADMGEVAEALSKISASL